MRTHETTASQSPMTPHAAQGAAHWLATLSDEGCTDAERRQFFEWLRASTHHVDEFLRLSTLARNAGRRELWPDERVESIIATARATSNITMIDTDGAPIAARPPRAIVRWAIAASVICVIAVGAAILSSTQLIDPFTGSYSTRVGEQRSITLEDGSVVELNSRSRLRTRFSATLRAVELVEGEAIFRVTKDVRRQFRVRTGATDIFALGTAFNVNATGTRTIVTVLEGRVRVGNRAGAASQGSEAPQEPKFVELAVGEQAIVAKAKPIVRVALEDTDKVTSWTERRLIFEDTPIATAAAEFARYSPRTIVIEDAQVGTRRISGVFDATDPASLIEFLGSDETLEVRPSDDGWSVRSRPLHY